MKQAHRHRFAAARLEIEIEDFGFHLARRGVQCREQRRTLAGDDIAELE